jgi:3-deoxy-manno-octulosonate cytidylyltransferase (CMP-KDO synthetase)
MKSICIIPARLNSYRFQRKPFAKIAGHTMIEHVYRRAALCADFDEIYLATPDEELRDHVEGFGGKVIMTENDCRRASDRVAIAVKSLDYQPEVIVNLQGDEALIRPETLSEVVKAVIATPEASCINVVRKSTLEESKDLNECKVVFDAMHNAMYMSREAIPSIWLGDKVFPYHIWIGSSGFSRESLEDYTNLPSTPLEIIESIDMLRFLESGKKIKIIETPYDTKSVDAPEDLDRASELMQNDGLFMRMDYSVKVRR